MTHAERQVRYRYGQHGNPSRYPATKSLNNLKERFKDAPMSQNTYEIDGIRYVVVSHYTGKKDIDKVISDLAEQRAYTEFGLSRS